MWNTIAMCVLQLIVMIIVHPYGIYAMIPLFVCINIVWLGIWHYFVSKLIGLSLWEALKDIVPFAVITAFAIAATYYITLRIENIYWLLLAKIVIAAAIYTFILWLINVKIFKESVQFITRRGKN